MFKILDEQCKPTKGSKFSAAIDLYSNEDIEILAGETVIVGLGVSIDKTKMPIYLQNNLHRHYLQLEPRSSLRAKGIISGTGIIDLDYEQEIKIVLHNFDAGVEDIKKFYIKKGDKIAQIMIKEHKSYLFDIESADKRIGGFGSTGNE